MKTAIQLETPDETMATVLAVVVDPDEMASALLFALDGPSAKRKVRSLRRVTVFDGRGRPVAVDYFGAFTAGLTIAGLSIAEGLDLEHGCALKLGTKGALVRLDLADLAQ